MRDNRKPKNTAAVKVRPADAEKLRQLAADVVSSVAGMSPDPLKLGPLAARALDVALRLQRAGRELLAVARLANADEGDYDFGRCDDTTSEACLAAWDLFINLARNDA